MNKLDQEYVRRCKRYTLKENGERNVYSRTSVQGMFEYGTVQPLNVMVTVLVNTAADYGVIVRTELGKVRIPGQRYS